MWSFCLHGLPCSDRETKAGSLQPVMMNSLAGLNCKAVIMIGRFAKRSSIKVSEPISAVGIEVTATDPLEYRQQELFITGTQPDAPP